MQLDINALLTLVLGGGLVGTITAFINGYRSLKEGAKSREKSTIEDLINQRSDAIRERDIEFSDKNFAFDQRDYWRNWAADLEFLMRSQGLPVPPRPVEPIREPKE